MSWIKIHDSISTLGKDSKEGKICKVHRNDDQERVNCIMNCQSYSNEFGVGHGYIFENLDVMVNTINIQILVLSKAPKLLGTQIGIPKK